MLEFLTGARTTFARTTFATQIVICWPRPVFGGGPGPAAGFRDWAGAGGKVSEVGRAKKLKLEQTNLS